MPRPGRRRPAPDLSREKLRCPCRGSTKADRLGSAAVDPLRTPSRSSMSPTTRFMRWRVRPGKGWLAAFRDATLFKVIYAWGLRRTEAAMLDVGDFGANPAAPELGSFGMCQVRFGKALRGSPPRRRAAWRQCCRGQSMCWPNTSRRSVLSMGHRLWSSVVLDRTRDEDLTAEHRRTFCRLAGGRRTADRTVGALPQALLHFT